MFLLVITNIDDTEYKMKYTCIDQYLINMAFRLFVFYKSETLV